MVCGYLNSSLLVLEVSVLIIDYEACLQYMSLQYSSLE